MIDNKMLFTDFLSYCKTLNLDYERVIACLCFCFCANIKDIQNVISSDSFFDSFEASYGI